MSNHKTKRAPFQGNTTKTSLRSPIHCLATPRTGRIDFFMALDLLEMPAQKTLPKQITKLSNIAEAISDCKRAMNLGRLRDCTCPPEQPH